MMVQNYNVKFEGSSEALPFLRLVTIKTSLNQITNFNRASNKKFTNRFIENIYLRHVGNSFYEALLKLDLNRLREIDGNEERRKELINDKLPPFVIARSMTKSDLVPFIFMILEFNQGDSFTDQDIEFILDILTWPSNSLFVVPTIQFSDEINSQDRIGIYSDFVNRLLEAKNQLSNRIKVAGSIPSFYPRASIARIFDLYENENQAPDLYVLDFNGERLTSTAVIGKINRIMAYFESIKNENYFIYGFNVKPFKKGEENPNAEDMGSFIYGLNAIGDKYRMKQSKFNPPPISNLRDLPKVFRGETYRYHRLSDNHAAANFSEWVQENLDPNFNINGDPKKFSSLTKSYNLDKVGLEAAVLSELVRSQDNDGIQRLINTKEIVKALSRRD